MRRDSHRFGDVYMKNWAFAESQMSRIFKHEATSRVVKSECKYLVHHKQHHSCICFGVSGLKFWDSCSSITLCPPCRCRAGNKEQHANTATGKRYMQASRKAWQNFLPAKCPQNIFEAQPNSEAPNSTPLKMSFCSHCGLLASCK